MNCRTSTNISNTGTESTSLDLLVPMDWQCCGILNNCSEILALSDAVKLGSQSVSYTESIKATTMTMTGIVEMYWIIDVVPHGGTCMENQTKCVKWYDKIMQLHGDRVNIWIALVVKRVQIHFSLLEKSCHSNIKNHGVTSLLRSDQLVSPVTQICHYWVAHPSLKYSCFNSISNIFRNKLNIFPHKQHLFSYHQHT